MWLGLLFSILCITMLSYNQFDDEPPEFEGMSESLFELYRLRTAQCLIIGDITKCLPYTVETLIHNAVAEHSRKDEAVRGHWMMASVVIRAAINMGYHRDPSRTSSVSVLQAELRRRVWYCVGLLDYGPSFYLGFPTMMSSIESDTMEPRNLHDWELSEETTILPPSRPLAEFTPVTFLIVKERLFRALGRITDFNNALKPRSYEELLEIDASLQEAFQQVPAHMKLPGGTSASGYCQSKSASTVSMLQMNFMYHQGLCALHRKFLARGRADQRYKVSRDRCMSSALALLAQQYALHQESQSKSTTPYWYKVSQTRHFFILATMILCLDLEHRRRNQDTTSTPHYEVLINALERSCEIWEEAQHSSTEAMRVHHVLSSVLLNFEPAEERRLCNEVLAVERSMGMTQSEQEPQVSNPMNPPFNHELLDTINGMDIDWVCPSASFSFYEITLTLIQATWDSFIEGATFEDSSEEIMFSGSI
jgi:hypothetical protein